MSILKYDIMMYVPYGSSSLSQATKDVILVEIRTNCQGQGFNSSVFRSCHCVLTFSFGLLKSTFLTFLFGLLKSTLPRHVAHYSQLNHSALRSGAD
jgi:hypothetical protein